MKTLKKIPTLVLAITGALLAATTNSEAQTVVYTENFEADHSLDNTWVTNSVGGYNPVDLYFDYSTVGIPAAPNSGGTTRGLKLQANLDPATGVFPSGSSVSPVGFNISANFEMRWDWWLNFNGPLLGGSSGSTQIGGAGFGTAATTANVPTIIDSIFVGCSGDGTGTTADYRVYTPAFSASLQDPSGVYAAGTSGSRNNTHAYYQTAFPPVSATNNCPNQLALYPQQTGLTQGGSAGMRWNDVSLKKIGNIITYTINGLLIASIDISTNGTLGGANIVFGQFDINAGVSLDLNATNLAFSLVDNVRITAYTNVVTVAATSPDAAETGSVPGVFKISRTGSGFVQTVNYSIGGTASNGVDYTNALGGALSGTITFAAGDTETNITIIPIDDAFSEGSETVILTILPGLYVGAGSATATIADNDAQQLSIASIYTQMYERTNDFATFRITRLGDTNAPAYTVNLAFSGTATLGTDYYADGPITLDQGVQSLNVKVYPIEDAAYEGNETVIVGLAAAGAGEYTIGAPGSASITLVDAGTPPGTTLFSDDFNVDSSANWTVFATDPTDFSATFAYDYSAQGIPPAPHGSGDTLGVFLTANKDVTGTAAAVNLYPNGKSFSGNYALRFDMFISVVVPNSVSTEYALFGINQSGTKTNWFRNSPGGVPAGWTFDGIFFDIEADGAGSGDYAIYSSPTTAGNNPTPLNAGRSSTTLTNEFKSPPNSVLGAPGNNTSLASPTPIWADVEVSQSGNLVTLKVNNTKIFSCINTGAFTSGNIMVGYDDAYDSIGLSSSYMIIDNVRVQAISPPLITGQPVNTTNAAGTPAAFSVTATTSTGITNYQWSLNGTNIANATNATYNIASVTAASFGSYRVEVSDGTYSSVSSIALLVPPVPVINVQPGNRASVVGGSPTLSVTATSYSGATNYQWFYYGTNVSGAGVSGATTRTLTLGGIQPAYFGGPYTVRVSDGTTSITSAPSATITVAQSPGITAPAVSGTNLVFSYPAEVGPNYVLDFKSAITNAAWTPLKTNTGIAGSINITNGMPGVQGYFRVRLQ